MTENKRFTIKRKDLKYAKILENGKDLTGYFFIAQAEFICDKWNELSEENEQLKKDCTALICHNQEYRKENEQLKQQMQRLYNYFADWFDDRVSSSDFSEMWDFVKEDEKWD